MQAKIPISTHMLGKVDMPFELTIWIEFRKHLHLLKTNLHENFSAKDIEVIRMTGMTFNINMKNMYKKYRERVHYCQINEVK